MKITYKFLDSFFDKLEDHVRAALARHPFVYSVIGGSGVILFWRGVWHSADYFEKNTYWGSYVFSNLGSMILGVVTLLITGLLVSVFIGDSIIMSGIRHDKKLIEKTEEEIEEEIKKEEQSLRNIERKIEDLNNRV